MPLKLTKLVLSTLRYCLLPSGLGGMDVPQCVHSPDAESFELFLVWGCCEQSCCHPAPSVCAWAAVSGAAAASVTAVPRPYGAATQLPEGWATAFPAAL